MNHEDVFELSLLGASTRLLDAFARHLDAQIHAFRILLGQLEQKLRAAEAELEHDAIRAQARAEATLAQRLGGDDGRQRIFRRFRDR